MTTNRFLALLYIGSCFSVLLSLLGMAAVFYVGSNFHKGPLHSRGSSISHLAVAISNGFRSLVKEIRQARSELTAVTVQEAELGLSHFTLVWAIGSLVTGILYVGIFAPLVWRAATHAGLNPVDVLLLQSIPPELDNSFFAQLFPRWSAPEARPVVYAFGTLYGATALALSMILLAGNLLRLVITANGLLYGFLLTRYLSVDVFGTLELDAFSSRLFTVKLAYIFLTYYLAGGMVILLGGKGYRQEKYKFLFDGMYGLLSGWILARGFGAGSVVFTGALFLGCTFLAMTVVERAMAWVFNLIRALTGKVLWETIEREESFRTRDLFVAIHRRIKELVGELLVVLLTFATFPIAAAGIYYVALEGRF